MIGFLPCIYPDELVYSWFCRYYVHSGYPSSKAALEDILYNRHCNPSKEFIGHLNPEMEQAVRRMYPMDELILAHTMFPQYARFIEPADKRNALHRLKNDFCDAHHLFSIIPRSEGDQYLKYCPLCMREDGELYGEAYWHRKHQIRNMNICTKHRCRLEDSNVTAKSSQTFTLAPAGIVLQEKEAKENVSPAELEFASYMEEIFESPMDFEENTAISAILYCGMEGTKYMSATGRTRNTKLLADELRNYYKEISLNDIASMYQIQRTLLGQRTDFSIISQISFFLGMPVRELLHPSLSEEQIQKSQDTRCPKENIPEDWVQYDGEVQPAMEQMAYGIYHGTINENGRPERVSERLLCRMIGISPHRLENMPKCREAIKKYEESYGENWARRLVWAYGKLKGEKGEERVFWSDLRKLAGVKKEKLPKALPYLGKHADKEALDEIMDILGEERQGKNM